MPFGQLVLDKVTKQPNGTTKLSKNKNKAVKLYFIKMEKTNSKRGYRAVNSAIRTCAEQP